MYTYFKNFIFTACMLMQPTFCHKVDSDLAHKGKQKSCVGRSIAIVLGLSGIVGIVGYVGYKGYNHAIDNNFEYQSIAQDIQIDNIYLGTSKQTLQEVSHATTKKDEGGQLLGEVSVSKVTKDEGGSLNDGVHHSQKKGDKGGQLLGEVSVSKVKKDEEGMLGLSKKCSEHSSAEKVVFKLKPQKRQQSNNVSNGVRYVEEVFTKKCIAECKLLGKGLEGKVYQVNDKYVIKVGKGIEKECKKLEQLALHSNNVVKAFGMAYLSKDKIKALVLEKLIPIEENLWDEDKGGKDDCSFVKNIVLPSLKTVQSWRKGKLEHTDLSNAKNFMQRQSGDFVIIDPMIRGELSSYNYDDVKDLVLHLLFMRHHTYSNQEHVKVHKYILNAFTELKCDIDKKLNEVLEGVLEEFTSDMKEKLKKGLEEDKKKIIRDKFYGDDDPTKDIKNVLKEHMQERFQYLMNKDGEKKAKDKKKDSLGYNERVLHALLQDYFSSYVGAIEDVLVKEYMKKKSLTNKTIRYRVRLLIAGKAFKNYIACAIKNRSKSNEELKKQFLEATEQKQNLWGFSEDVIEDVIEKDNKDVFDKIESIFLVSSCQCKHDIKNEKGRNLDQLKEELFDEYKNKNKHNNFLVGLYRKDIDLDTCIKELEKLVYKC